MSFSICFPVFIKLHCALVSLPLIRFPDIWRNWPTNSILQYRRNIGQRLQRQAVIIELWTPNKDKYIHTNAIIYIWLSPICSNSHQSVLAMCCLLQLLLCSLLCCCYRWVSIKKVCSQIIWFGCRNFCEFSFLLFTFNNVCFHLCELLFTTKKCLLVCG